MCRTLIQTYSLIHPRDMNVCIFIANCCACTSSYIRLMLVVLAKVMTLGPYQIRHVGLGIATLANGSGLCLY